MEVELGESTLGRLSDDELGAEILASLANGELVSTALLTLTQRTITRIRTHPAIAGAGSSDRDRVTELSHDFLLDKCEVLRITLLANAPAPTQAAAMVRTTVKHWLNDVWRTTAFGSLNHRLAQALAEQPEFTVVAASHWTLADHPVGEWRGDEAALLAAARGVKVKVPVWKSENRRPPAASRADLVSVVVAILREAGGPVPLSVITRVCLARFPHTNDPDGTAPQDVLEADQHCVPDVADEVADILDEESEAGQARALVAGLTDDECFILVHQADLAVIGRRLGVEKSQASARRIATVHKIQNLLNETSDPHSVGSMLLQAIAARTQS